MYMAPAQTNPAIGLTIVSGAQSLTPRHNVYNKGGYRLILALDPHCKTIITNFETANAHKLNHHFSRREMPQYIIECSFELCIRDCGVPRNVPILHSHMEGFQQWSRGHLP